MLFGQTFLNPHLEGIRVVYEVNWTVDTVDKIKHDGDYKALYN